MFGGTDYKFSFPLNAGISYQKGSFLFNLDAKLNLNSKREIYVNRTQTTTMFLPNYMVSFGVRKLFEGTVPQFEKRFENGSMKKEYKKTKGKLNAISFNIGLSSSVYISSSEYNQNIRKYVSKTPSQVFPEFGIGYYLDKPDLHFNLAYRNFTSTGQGFGIEQLYARKSITFEAFKFLLDYKGFVPFVGLGVSREAIGFMETDFGAKTVVASQTKFTPNLTFGWDIRYHRNNWFMFRTTMRYYPFLYLNSQVGEINFNQLELNFIQAVFYPQRLKYRKQHKIENTKSY